MLTQSCFQAPLEGGCSQAPVQYLSNSDPNDAAFFSKVCFLSLQDKTGLVFETLLIYMDDDVEAISS